jgi:hypothetical protein
MESLYTSCSRQGSVLYIPNTSDAARQVFSKEVPFVSIAYFVFLRCEAGDKSPQIHLHDSLSKENNCGNDWLRGTSAFSSYPVIRRKGAQGLMVSLLTCWSCWKLLKELPTA